MLTERFRNGRETNDCAFEAGSSVIGDSDAFGAGTTTTSSITLKLSPLSMVSSSSSLSSSLSSSSLSSSLVWFKAAGATLEAPKGVMALTGLSAGPVEFEAGALDVLVVDVLALAEVELEEVVTAVCAGAKEVEVEEDKEVVIVLFAK